MATLRLVRPVTVARLVGSSTDQAVTGPGCRLVAGPGYRGVAGPGGRGVAGSDSRGVVVRSCHQTANTYLDTRIRELSKESPVPISIAEFLERGGEEKISEGSSYAHLLREVSVRLSHLLIELQHLPEEVREQDNYKLVYDEYLQTYSQLLQFQGLDPTKENLEKWTEFLKTIKIRHKDVVPDMAKACMGMKHKYGISLQDDECALTNSIQYSMDRLYMSRISLNMLTNQHLMVYGHKANIMDQVGVIHPRTNIEAVVRHAYENALYLCEQCYLTGPELVVTSQNATNKDCQVVTTQIPSHIYHIVFEIMKNSMQAVVDSDWAKEDDDKTKGDLPPIEVLLCQSDKDITIRVSDKGGGIERRTSHKIFKYLYTTAPMASPTSETAPPLSGLGYGLPLARLYARYFQGDLRAASYEGHGTDIYIYLHALAGEAVERLPVWSPTSIQKMSARSSPLPDWTGDTMLVKQQQITK